MSTPVFAQFGSGSPFPTGPVIKDDGTLVEGSGAILDLRDNISVTFDSLTSTYHVAASAGGSVSDAVYGITWDGITTVAPSKNAVYDKIQTLGGGHDAVTLAGTPNYLTLSGQIITLTKLDVSDDTNATGGTGVDINTNDFVVDATELEALTWGAGGNASNIWTFNLSGTDPTITFNSGAVAIGGALSATGAVTGSNLSGTNTGDNTVATTGDSATSFFSSGTLEEGLLPDSATVTGWALGASTATTLNKLTLTQPATGSTLTILDGKTFTVNNTATIGTLTDTKFCTYTAAGTSIDCTSAGGSGAPTTADYLVGTADAGLSAEIVVGTAPGGELGNTWASPTLDDSLTVTGWELGAATAATSLTSPAFISNNADPADAGIFRLGNAENITWEASPAGTDETLTVSSAENFQISGPLEVDASDPADAEAIRLDNAEGIAWEASPTGTDVTLKVDASEILQVSGALNAGGAVTGSNLSGTNTGDNDQVGIVTNGNMCTADGSAVQCTTVPATGILTWLVTPSSANLGTALTDETGTGAVVLGTSPTITTSLLFSAPTVTLGAHTLAGALDSSTQIITNIGNVGTDFVATTGALTLAGILTANGGITLPDGQLIDLSGINNSVTTEGLKLPQGSVPTGGTAEGQMAWDTDDNNLLVGDASTQVKFLPVPMGIFGDGSDGAGSITGNTTLTRIMYYSSLTVDAGITLTTNSHHIFVTGTLTNNGTITATGNAGGNASTATGGTAGTNQTQSTADLGYAASSTGKSGGTAAGTAGATTNVGQMGGAGGTGGTGGTGSSGVGGASAAATSVVDKSKRVLFSPLLANSGNSGANLALKGGAAGSTGGSGGGDGTAGGGSGASGSGGGIVCIVASIITNNGTISANGGAGGNGASPAAGNRGGGAGSGGGGGGTIWLAYRSLTAGTLSVAGGAAGTGAAGTGTGTAGTDGSDGSTGIIMKYNINTGAFE